MKPFSLDTKVIQTEPALLIELTINNHSDIALKNWLLTTDFNRFILPETLSKGSVKQVGTYTEIKPDQDVEISAGGSYQITFAIKSAPFTNYECGAKSAFLSLADDNFKSQHEGLVSQTQLKLEKQDRTNKILVSAADIAIIPKVNNLKINSGFFNVKSNLLFAVSDDLAMPACDWLVEELSYAATLTQSGLNVADIEFTVLESLAENEYQISVSPRQIILKANSAGGFIHAVASLLQLVKKQISEQTVIDCVEISDKPRFDYRGAMLDCARHFHSIDTVKRLINQMAMYKLNYFHWHFTDDEAWRIEIKAFPALTEIGAWRGIGTKLLPQFSHLTEKYGGFYTQAEIKEVIAYAKSRGITVIPEIDIPGHCRAAIKSLPDLLIDANDKSEYLSIQAYTDNVLSPALAGTYEFLDAVIDEVCALFPSPYIHIGADEVPKGVWTKSDKCQALMKEQGYQDEMELQGHLLRHVEARLKENGKRMLGWEEVKLGGKVSKETIVYSWLSEEAALECVKSGFDVVMQPCQYTYLDIKQDFAPEELGVDWAGTLPLEKVYNYSPLAELKDDSALRSHILGVQCALWSEVVLNRDYIDHMLFPRLLACAEVAWSQAKDKNWDDFCSRLQGQKEYFKRNNINYRKF